MPACETGVEIDRERADTACGARTGTARAGTPSKYHEHSPEERNQDTKTLCTLMEKRRWNRTAEQTRRKERERAGSRGQRKHTRACVRAWTRAAAVVRRHLHMCIYMCIYMCEYMCI